MAEIFFTSDTHFGHTNIIKHCNRPYTCKEEMDEDIVKKWNDRVSKNDIVYHLGDVTWYGPKGAEILGRLKGTKHLMLGNHDSLRVIGNYFEDILDYKRLCPRNNLQLILMHYPIQSWHLKERGSIHLHGHTHGNIDNTGLLRFDIGVDCCNMAPISLDEVLKLAEAEIERREIQREQDIARRIEEGS